MKFLQTGDWHLGKFFYEHSLILDQQFFLDQIINELKNEDKKGEPYDALIVPGDIYDRAVPPAESVTLFSNFLSTVHSEFADLQMFFLAGNHDSATRLSFAAELLSNNNIHICTDTKSLDKPVIVGKKGFQCAVYQIPFLTPGSIPQNETVSDDTEPSVLRTQQQLFDRALEIIKDSHKKNNKDIPSVVCAHLFTTGASVSDSERSWVGAAEQVDSNVFDGINYAAIGHIHKKQMFKNKTVCYSGAPLAYSFGENADKCMLKVLVSSEKTTVEEIAINPLHPVVRLSGTFEEFYKPVTQGSVEENLKNSYIEIQCTDNLVHENAMQLLRSGYPNLLSFTRVSSAINQGLNEIADRKAILSSEKKDEGAIFDLFLKDISSEDPLNEKNPDFEICKKERELFVKFSKGSDE